MYSHKIPREASDTERNGQRYIKNTNIFPIFFIFQMGIQIVFALVS